MIKKQRKSSGFWDEEKIILEIQSLREIPGFFFSSSYLRKINRNDILCAITRNGGFYKFSKLLKLPLAKSDTSFGWEGEREITDILLKKGYDVQKQNTKHPFDLLIDKLLRIDVKTARKATYGESTGWFYRIGKSISADLIITYQFDTKDFYLLPWFVCPTTNITISSDGGIYKKYKNNFEILNIMLKNRNNDLSSIFNSQ